MNKVNAQSLFPGEALHWLNGIEYLTYFKKGNADKFLIVFLPGWGHLGRIAYAGAGISPEDFLAHAFLEKGYSFLAISYPLEHPVYSQPYPQMHLQDWAQAAADMAGEICKEHELPGLIPVHWSAAGQLMTSFHKASQALKLSHLFSVSLEATPPILIPPERTRVAEIQPNGLASVRKLYSYWHQQVCAMLNYKLDSKNYEEAFLGSFPIALLGNSLVYSNDTIQEDLAASIKDRCSFDYGEAPLVVNISGNSQLVPYHPLVDRTSWSFVNERKIYHGYLAPITSHIAHFSNERWNNLLTLIQTFNDNMIHFIEGNHFLFVGQKHAQQIVHIVEETEKTVAEFLENLKQFLSP
jgi:hypothetical protein